MQFLKENKLLAGVITVLVALAIFMFAHSKGWAADKGGPIPGVSRAEAEQMFPTAPWTAFYVSAGVVTGSLTSDYGIGVDGWGINGRAGADVQLDKLVFGGFCDAQWDHVNTSFLGTTVSAQEYGCGARAGVLPTPSTLVYGLVGYKWLYLSNNLGNTKGIDVGGGIETAVTKHWRLALEYNHIEWDALSAAREQTVMGRVIFAFPVGR
jgi:opacity protein-like surface antigen